MAIVTSVIELDVDLGNGMRSIHEQHTDSVGEVHVWRRFAPVGYDAAADLPAHAAALAEQLAAAEFDALVAP